MSHNLFKPSFSKNGYQQNYLNQNYALTSIKSDNPSKWRLLQKKNKCEANCPNQKRNKTVLDQFQKKRARLLSLPLGFLHIQKTLL